jgi:hypothetical protein
MRLECEQDIATASMENPLADLALPKVGALKSLSQDVRRMLCGESRYGTGQNVSQHSVLMLEPKRSPLRRIDK